MSVEQLRERDPRKLIPPLHGALLKNEQDVHLFERLAFLSRREVVGSRVGWVERSETHRASASETR
ncbi:hypothetical protein AXW67_06660 [Bradyrhizobium neotropicale]|uniref:Uncharacterized protein n=1 Tax=Bradyrhizobium neotropicale TaxID=1497615 RepID=A0A176ZE79_9BRAD|nr:hypothetical protein AXW67_06660 [Bradyrhizobium neotropicale]